MLGGATRTRAEKEAQHGSSPRPLNPSPLPSSRGSNSAELQKDEPLSIFPAAPPSQRRLILPPLQRLSNQEPLFGFFATSFFPSVLFPSATPTPALFFAPTTHTTPPDHPPICIMASDAARITELLSATTDSKQLRKGKSIPALQPRRHRHPPSPLYHASTPLLTLQPQPSKPSRKRPRSQSTPSSS